MKRAVIFFWLTVACGAAIPAVVAIWTASAKGAPLQTAIQEWTDNLFAPGANELVLTLISAAPFLLLAVLSLFHMSGGNSGPRTAGVSGALMAGVALAVQVHSSIRMSHHSTAAIGFFFLPFEELIVMPIGYGFGRLVSSLLRRLKP